MITIHRKLISAVHGYHKLQLPVGAKILSVGVQGTGSIPIFVQVEDSEKTMQNFDIYVSMTNLRCAAEEATYLGTCALDQMQSAHIFMLS